MKKICALFCAIMAITIAMSQKTQNYDFGAVAPSGQTLYYSISGCNVTVTYPSSSESSPYYGFTEPTGDLVIPNSVVYNGTAYLVTSIGRSAFSRCSGLRSVTMGNTVTSIRYAAFHGCTGLESVTIGNAVDSIRTLAFSCCTGLTSVTIPNSVTYIGPAAFQVCTGLTAVIIPDSVTSIGGDAFRNCTSLTSVTIGNGVSSIGKYAFDGCTGLTSVTIPNSVISIGNPTFSNCSDLISIAVDNGNTVYDSRDNCNAIIESATNTLLTGCKNTVIPNTVTSIGISAFSGCTGLTSVTIPNSVTTIDTMALSGCTQIANIYIRSITPPTVQSNSFYGVPTTANLYVPCDAVTAYANTAPWNQFNMADFAYSFSATTADITRGMVQVIHAPECTNWQAEVQANPYHGFHFVRWNDGDTNAYRYLVVVQDTAIEAIFLAEGETESIDDVNTDGISVWAANGRIHVSVDGELVKEFRVYDLIGREVFHANNADDTSALLGGVYLVKVGTLPAKKVVVIR